MADVYRSLICIEGGGGACNAPHDCPRTVAKAYREVKAQVAAHPAALLLARAEAMEEAAAEVECFNSAFAPAFVKDEDCPPCDDCVKGALLRGYAAHYRAEAEKAGKGT